MNLIQHSQYSVFAFCCILMLFSCDQSRQSKNKNEILMKDKGLISITSHHSIDVTMNDIELLLKEEGFQIFTKIDHGEAAKKYDHDLNPTQLIIFGNPENGGTSLMQENQRMGIDLPAKILVWEDDSGSTHITYNDIRWLADRHDLTEKNSKVINALNQTISRITEKAAQK